MSNQLLDILSRTDDAGWLQIVERLQPEIHAVDQRAARIWFAFFPVKLFRALSESANPEEKAKSLLLKGKYRLTDQVDSSAQFLYGHRYWPEVRREVAEYASGGGSSRSLADQILETASKIATRLGVEVAMVTGITAVAFGTLQQVGIDLFKEPAQAGDYGKSWKKSANQIVEDRKKDDSQGILGFLKSVDKTFTVNFREFEPGYTFKVVNMQDVTTAGRQYKGDYHSKDMRCMRGEGPIPVECRTAACGTCWVGVLSPTEKLAPPNDREINKWRYFGYEGFTANEDSPIRLACQLKAHGNVTLVIPPWNGLIGKLDEKEKETGAAA